MSLAENLQIHGVNSRIEEDLNGEKNVFLIIAEEHIKEVKELVTQSLEYFNGGQYKIPSDHYLSDASLTNWEINNQLRRDNASAYKKIKTEQQIYKSIMTLLSLKEGKNVDINVIDSFCQEHSWVMNSNMPLDILKYDVRLMLWELSDRQEIRRVGSTFCLSPHTNQGE